MTSRWNTVWINWFVSSSACCHNTVQLPGCCFRWNSRSFLRIHLIAFALRQARASDGFGIAFGDDKRSQFEHESYHKWWLSWGSGWFLVKMLDTKEVVHANTPVAPRRKKDYYRFIKYLQSVSLLHYLLCHAWCCFIHCIRLYYCYYYVTVFTTSCLILGVLMQTCLLTKARMLNLQRKPQY